MPDSTGADDKPPGPRRDRAAPDDHPRVKLELDEVQAVAAATGSAIAHILSRPDSIRQRAQYAATISSAFAAALVIAALGHLTGGGESYESLTISLVFLATVLWAITAAMFVWAVAFVAKPPAETKDLGQLVEAYGDYADDVRRQMRLAATASALALVVTVAALFAELAEQLTSSTTRVLLAPDAVTDVVALCDWEARPPLQHVEGEFPSGELNREIVSMKEAVGQFEPERAGEEPTRMRCTPAKTVRIPRSAIRAAVDLK